MMCIEQHEPELKALIDPAAELECLSQGFQFTEGPVWDPAKRCLYFSDIPADTIYRYTKANGVEVYRTPSHFSNGLTIDHQGRLLTCEHRTRRVTREGIDGSVEVLAERYGGKRLNSPNDIIVTREGTLIFTDPHYGLMPGIGGPAEQELPFRGVYRLNPGATEPTLLADDFAAPNGLALTGDERKLYVDDTIRSHIRVFEVGDGWTLSGGRVFWEFPNEEVSGLPGVPEGMKLDIHDNVFCTGPGGVWILSPSAVALGHIRMPEVTANLNWGEDDARTLYLTASTSLYQLRCITSGRGESL